MKRIPISKCWDLCIFGLVIFRIFISGRPTYIDHDKLPLKLSWSGHVIWFYNLITAITNVKTCQFKTWCKGNKSNIENSIHNHGKNIRQNITTGFKLTCFFYPRDTLHSAVFPSCSVCPSVCHTPVLCLNG